MLDEKILEDGVVLSIDTMSNIFNSMMEDRDTLDEERWLDRYAHFILDINKKVVESTGNEMTEKELLDFTARVSYQIYSKEYDKKMDEVIKPKARA